MQAWNVLRQLLAVALCAVLALPASSTVPLSSSAQSHAYDKPSVSRMNLRDAGASSRTHIWVSSKKILLHTRVVRQLSGEQPWSYAQCNGKALAEAGDTYDYDAFGNLLHSSFTGTAPTPNNYLFAGEQFDPDLNLYYNRARYLNVSTGRFWSTDSYEGYEKEPSSLHKYLYAGGDPIDRLDPSGRDFLDTLGAAAISLGTFANQAAIVATTVLGSVYINLYRVPEVIETASSYLTVGLGAFETLRFLGTNVLNYTERYSSIPVIRGGEFEEAAGANLDRWFPAFDYYDKDTGVAVQIRSTTQTSSPEALLAVVRKGVNRVNNLPPVLTGLDREGEPLTIARANIKAKGLLIGIPAKPLPWFGTFLQQVREISESEKVAITVQFVEGLEGETTEK